MVDPVTGAVTRQLTRWSLKWIGRQIGFVFYCKRSIKNLKEEVQRLRAVIETVEGKVERANNNAQIIYPLVSLWLSEAKTKEEEVVIFLEDEIKLKCCNGWCPDLRWRRRLGEESQTMAVAVAKLKEEEGGNQDQVGYPAPLSLIPVLSDQNSLHFETRNSVLNQIVAALEDDSSSIIGIYGMPGVGKTTTVERAAELAHQKGLFQEFTRADISQNPDVRKIQDQLADWLNMKFEANSEDGRAAELRNRLENGKRILVIIDDVWDEIDLKNKIGIPFTEKTKGCKILLTSRDSKVCRKMMGDQETMFEIRLLSGQEAWQLFREKAGSCVDSDQLRPVAEKVCEECGGLPLAIVTLGAALKREDEPVWNAVLQQLKTSSGSSSDDPITGKIHASIELSFRYSLNNKEVRSCFYYCCLFPEDAEISIGDLVKYGIGTRFLQVGGPTNMIEKARDRVQMCVGRLKASCFLLEVRNQNFVKMHDVIRDVAMSVASKEYAFLVQNGVGEWPEEYKFKHCTVISLELTNNNLELPQELNCPELRTLVLKGCGHVLNLLTNLLAIPNDFFKGTEGLEVLELYGMQLEASATSLSNLVNLRVLCLEGCMVDEEKFLKQLKNLEILSFSVSEVKEAISTPIIGQLTCLCSLDLIITNLRHLPSGVITSLTRLEELYIQGRCDANLAELSSLTHLNALKVTVSKKYLPLQDLGFSFQKLKRFKISIGCRFKMHDPYYPGEKILKVCGVSLDNEINVLMGKSEALHLIEVEDPEKVLDSREGTGFLDLKFLQVEECGETLKHLLGKCYWMGTGVGDSNSFGKLSVLQIDKCGVDYLFSPSVARALAQLQELNVGGCDAMEVIVGVENEQVAVENNIIFPRLKKINLTSLSGDSKLKTIYSGNTTTPTTAQTLFNEKVSFPALEELYIFGLQYIKAIWSHQLLSIESFENLVKLEVYCCDSMLSVVDCEEGCEMETLVFPKLKTMELGRLTMIKGFCNGHGSTKALFNKVWFPALERFEIRHLECITSIWEWDNHNHNQSLSVPTQVELSLLQALVGERYDNLVNLGPFNGVQRLSNLVQLKIVSCNSMISIVEAININRRGEAEEDDDKIVVFPQLKDMTLGKLPSFKTFCYIPQSNEAAVKELPIALFSKKVALPCLECLSIERINKLKEIWERAVEADSFCKLKYLEFSSCEGLLSIAPSRLLQSFQNLECLQIYQCQSLDEVFKVEGSKAAKEIISLKVDYNPIFPKLRRLKLNDLPNLMHLHPWICISKLRSLEISWTDCPKFEKDFAVENVDEEETIE